MPTWSLVSLVGNILGWTLLVFSPFLVWIYPKMRNSFHLALNNVSSYALFSSSTLYTGSFHFLSQTNESGLVLMVNLTQAIKSTNHWMLVGNYLFCYRLYFLDLRLERVLRITLRSERFSKGVHNNWSYHCLYFQTPGQLENFFKLESCLLDISAKTIILPEKSIYWDILVPNSRSGGKTFVYAQAGTKLVIWLPFSYIKSLYWEYLNNQSSKPLYFPIKSKI